MKKTVCILLFVFHVNYCGYSQTRIPVRTNTTTPAAPAPAGSPDCSRKGSDFRKYNDPVFYIPKENDPDKIIKLNFNIFRDNKGRGNFQNIHVDSVRLKTIFRWVNDFYTHRFTPSDPIPGVVDLPRTYIRFELNAIYFYDDSTLINSISGAQLLKKIRSVDPARMQQMNICFTEGKLGTAAGIASTLPDYNFEEDMCLVMMNVYNNGSDVGDYARSSTLAHELGHGLDLIHTYIGGGASVHCAKDSLDPEYLEDVFGKWPGNCPHFVTDAAHPWGFDVNSSTNDRRTNNLMGGFQASSYLSPKQIGIMHRTLALKTTRRYVSNAPFSPNTITITGNEVWDFNTWVYSNVEVLPGASLTVKCSVSFSSKAKILVGRKAKLIIDGGKLSSISEEWEGLELQKNKWWQVFSGPKKKRVILLNKGTIEKARSGKKTA